MRARECARAGGASSGRVIGGARGTGIAVRAEIVADQRIALLE